MTENEAIEEVKRWTSILLSAGAKCVSETAEAQDMAIKALEEVQQYRAIGTPEECQTAVEKQIAMKVTDIHVDEYHCPACGSENTTSDALTVGDHYCPNCGQRLE